MPKVTLKHQYEQFDSLLRRWKKALEKDDTAKDARKHEFYEKPSDIKKRAKAAAVKRAKRKSDEEKNRNQKFY